MEIIMKHTEVDFQNLKHNSLAQVQEFMVQQSLRGIRFRF